MKLRNTLPYVGTFLKVNALILLVPIPLAYYFNEPINPLLIASAACFLTGFFFTKRKHEEIKYSETVLLSAFILVCISVFGAIPFFMNFEGPILNNAVDAFFESVSGYTTTGLSVINDVEVMPKSLIFLRSLFQWVGGIGIVVLSFSALMYGTTSFFLYREEQDFNRILPSVRKSAKTIITIYILYTLLGSGLLWLSGMSLFESVSSMFATLSTGGFSYGKVLYPNLVAKLVFMVFMVLGSMSFAVHYSLFNRKFRDVFSNIQFKLVGAFILIGVILFTLVLIYSGESFITALDKSVFNVISALTTTGFSDIDFSQLNDLGKFVTVIFMSIGGGMGSTAGGLKIFRVYVLFRGVVWFVKKNLAPGRAIIPLKVEGKPFSLSEVNLIVLFFFAYMLIMVSATVVLTAYGYSGIDSLFVSASALGTVGLSTLDVASMPVVAKLVLTLEMMFGRVEIVSLAALIGHVMMRTRQGFRD